LYVLAFAVLLGAEPEPLLSGFSKEQQERALAITVRLLNQARHSRGSGILLGKTGPTVYALTASHVVADAREVDVETFSAASYPRPAKVYRSAEIIGRSGRGALDLALIRFSASDPIGEKVRIGKTQAYPPNFLALSAGCSTGRPPSCSVESVVSTRLARKGGQADPALYWQTKERPARGRSGGPLLDGRGRLIGVCCGSNGDAGYYCHIDEIVRFLKQQGLQWLVTDDP
jgi:S1-C subfamily serine protease